MMSLENRQKLVKRLTIVGTYLLVAWVILAGVEIHSLTVYARNWSNAQQNLVMVERVFSDLKDCESGQRGYIITGQKDYFDQFTIGSASLDYDLKVLTAYLESEPRQQDTLAELNTVIKAKRKEMILAAQTFTKSGFAPAQEIIRSNRGAVQMKHIRYLIDVIKAREQAWLKSAAGISITGYGL